MRCSSGLDELEHAAFQVESYSGGRGRWGDVEPASGSQLHSGEVWAGASGGTIGAAQPSTFSL